MTVEHIRLGEIADMLSGYAFKSSEFLDHEEEGVFLVRGDNVQQGYIRWGEKAKKWRKEEYNDFHRYQLEKNDVILAMDRPIVGGGLKLAWIKEQDLPSLLVQRVTRIRGIPGKARTNYLRYALSTSNFLAHIDKITTGANIPHISGKDIANFSLQLPCLDTQDRITEFIATYDDLIGNNRRRIALLEESARLLYREWFVNLRFPGYESASIKNGLPDGWQAGIFADFVDAVGGATPDTKRPDFWDGDITWLTPTDVTRNDCLFLIDSERKISSSGYESCSAKILPPGTIFMTSRASIGYFALLDKPACSNQGFIAILPKIDHARNYLLFHLMSRVEEFEAVSTGATFKELSKKKFKDLRAVMPDLATLSAFSDKTQPTLDLIKTLKMQSSYLIEARNSLLPKLMSGEIQV